MARERVAGARVQVADPQQAVSGCSCQQVGQAGQLAHTEHVAGVPVSSTHTKALIVVRGGQGSQWLTYCWLQV